MFPINDKIVAKKLKKIEQECFTQLAKEEFGLTVSFKKREKPTSNAFEEIFGDCIPSQKGENDD